MNSGERFFRRFIWSMITAIGFMILIAYFLSGCSTSNRREQLQQEHPECFVFEDLTIECPNPFDSSAGFGTSIQIEKPNKKKTKAP